MKGDLTMWIEKTKKGHYKFVEGYKDPYTGKTKRISVTYQKNTSAVRKQALQELSNRIYKAMNKISHTTYNEAMKVYLKSIDIKPTTLKTKRSSLKFMSKYFDDGEIYIDTITSAYIRDFYLNSNSYISRGNMDILKTFFNWCYKNDYMSTKVFDKVTLKEQRHNPNYKKLFFEKEEMTEILKKFQFCKSYTEQLSGYIVEFITLTGLRIGELAALRCEDLSGNTLSITKNYSRDMELTPKSSKSVRTITINSRAVQIIKEVELLKRIHCIETDLIFPNSRGNYLIRNTITDILKRLDIYPARLHIFRHTHASILAEKGISLDAIQRRLGHENDKITKEIYVHITERMCKKERELFEELEIL